MTEPTYTLDEARRILARETCAEVGHSFAHVITGRGDLIRVFCTVCDKAWNVSPPEHSTAPTA